MVSISIDNIKIKISSQSTVLEACEFAGIIVPRFCFHKKLSIAGNCRMCLVEIEKFPKPVSSCTLNVSEGMRIFTKTPLVRKAQETVLEFLLINHPLDCPICDQGGECDLQDQLNFFGSDSSRFFKLKRGVSDKNCGPFVKTIMTRCIHCTRCVRFLSEIGSTNSFGMLGRSSNAEIGLYVSDNLKSEFSGNVIDLCPVGALTSKPYSFKGRSWELTNYRTIDILDSLNSDIIVSLKGFDVLRVLPCYTSYNITEWIPDRTRFFYDSFNFFRIKKCWLRIGNSFVDWSTTLDLIKKKLIDCKNKKNNLGMFLGSTIDLETAMLSKFLCNLNGSSDLYTDINCSSSLNSDFRSNYAFGSFKDLQKSDVCLIIGSNLRTECPNLNLLIKQKVQDDSLKVGYIGASIDCTYPFVHVGLDIEALIMLVKGKHPFSYNLKKAKNPSIILGERFNNNEIFRLITKLVNLGCLTNFNHSNVYPLRMHSSSVSFNEVGIQNFKTRKIFDLLFLIGVDDLKPYRYNNPDSFIIYMGSHYSVYNLEMADLILPASVFIEKDFKVINLENRIKESKALRKVSGDIRPEWYLLLVLLLGADSSLVCLDKASLFQNLFLNEYPFIFKKNFKLSEFTIEQTEPLTISNKLLGQNIFDFYKNISMIRSSKNFKFCSDTLKQVKFKKKMLFNLCLVALLKSLSLLLLLLITVAFFVLVERKVLGSVQRRRGPNVVGIFGLLQSFADGFKLILKETIIPSNSNSVIFLFSPIFTFLISLLGWAVIPFGIGGVIVNFNLGILYFFAVSSLGVYSIIMAGWSSNSKYAFLGSIRSAAQMISYEISMGFVLITVFICAGSLNLTSIVLAQEKIWYVFPLLPMFIVFFISALAETNRHPFDLPEAEAELVSGYNVEYSASGFALFFLGEYSNILLMGAVISILFLGGWLPVFGLGIIPFFIWLPLKIVLIAFVFIIIRGVLPRYRYDQLMDIGWKVFIPITLGWLVFISGILISFDMLPNFIQL